MIKGNTYDQIFSFTGLSFFEVIELIKFKSAAEQETRQLNEKLSSLTDIEEKLLALGGRAKSLESELIKVKVTAEQKARTLNEARKPVARLSMWSIFMQAYDFDTTHRKGTIHTNADAFSIPVVPI